MSTKLHYLEYVNITDNSSPWLTCLIDCEGGGGQYIMV